MFSEQYNRKMVAINKRRRQLAKERKITGYMIAVACFLTFISAMLQLLGLAGA